MVKDMQPRAATPFWLWPNLLSLDAPVVALLWQFFFSRCFHASVGAVPAALLASTVWLIYVADRALDGRNHTCRSPRHDFYKDHWRRLLPVWIAVFITAGWLAVERLSSWVFAHGLALLAVVMVYFGLVHFASTGFRRYFPKEAAVGVLFALGTSLATWPQVKTVGDAGTILVFSLLCWINCVAIEKWESRLEWPVGLAAAVIAAFAVGLFFGHRPVLAGAEIASASGLWILDRLRRKLPVDALRVLADVALLSPVFFLPLAGHA
jgi:hypothetical protein